MASRDMSRALDEPPNSRLFILCQKGTTEQEFRDSFETFGCIEDVWIIKDKRTYEDRGIVYIKFSKTSEAMHAMEEMNGKTLPGATKGLKVVVANSKRDGSTRDPREDERLVRLFVIIPKHFTEQNLREEFSKFGDLESVTILKDRTTRENKGFGYVRFFKPLHAAMAYENCDNSYRPKFAEPQRSRDEREEIENHGYSLGYSKAGHKRNYEEDFNQAGGYFAGDSSAGFRQMAPAMTTGPSAPMDLLADYPTPNQGSRLIIQAPIGLTQGYISKLFNLIPGMEYCDINENTGVAYARYCSPQCAAYARDRLNGFEYPLGSPLHVQFADEGARNEFPMSVDNYSHTQSFSANSNQYNNYGQQAHGGENMDIRHKAAKILEKAGINPQNLINMTGPGSTASLGSVGDGRRERVPYCNIPLPPPQPNVTEDGSNLARRLFIVCQPSGVSERILKDAFCRFGNLIDVYLLSGRNYGYAKFASKESAMKAIETLHGQTLAGQRLKVLEAEPPKQHPSSHQSMQDDEGPLKKPKL